MEKGGAQLFCMDCLGMDLWSTSCVNLKEMLLHWVVSSCSNHRIVVVQNVEITLHEKDSFHLYQIVKDLEYMNFGPFEFRAFLKFEVGLVIMINERMVHSNPPILSSMC
jgi:hypothetical protein